MWLVMSLCVKVSWLFVRIMARYVVHLSEWMTLWPCPVKYCNVLNLDAQPCLVSRAWSAVPGQPCLVSRAWSAVPGQPCLVSRAWSAVPGRRPFARDKLGSTCIVKIWVRLHLIIIHFNHISNIIHTHYSIHLHYTHTFKLSKHSHPT